MEQKQLFKVRDKRNKGWFWLDNDYFNGYAKLFGAIGTAVYLSLCRHADNETQKCYPSEKTIAIELNITDRTVRKYIKLFSKYGLIEITKERTNKGKWLNNTYWLLDKSEWNSPEEIISDGSIHRKLKAHPEETEDISRGNGVPLKDTNKKDTYNKDTHSAGKPAGSGTYLKKEIDGLIDLFKEVNPTYGRLFGNTTQRKATERLIKQFGLVEITNIIRILPQTNLEEFFPVITTPYLLEQKIGNLIAQIQKRKNKPSSFGEAYNPNNN